MLHVYHVHCHGDELLHTVHQQQHINHQLNILQDEILLLSHVQMEKHALVRTEVYDEHTPTKVVHYKDVVTTQ
jgi:hypothetical protein